MTSDTQKKARNKWDSNNMSVLGCKLRKDEAEAFKAACQKEGTTPNAIFKQAIAEFMERQAGTVEPPTEAEAQARVVVVSSAEAAPAESSSQSISLTASDLEASPLSQGTLDWIAGRPALQAERVPLAMKAIRASMSAMEQVLWDRELRREQEAEAKEKGRQP